MDLHLDTCWCPVCGRQILPKRFLVPLHPPAVPPSSPQIPQQLPHDPPTNRRSKPPHFRHRGGGLVHGTGRVKPNGTIRRSDSTTSIPPTPNTTTPNTASTKMRTIIDQGPVPLYCSDECHRKDLCTTDGALDINFNPDRHSPPSATTTACQSFSSQASESTVSSDATTNSSLDSPSSSFTPLATTKPTLPNKGSHSKSPGMSRSMATLFEMYHWEMPPPAPPLCSSDTSSDSEPFPPNQYENGIIMTGRRITAACRGSTPSRPRSLYGREEVTKEPRKIPGWHDGTNAWRAEVYNLVTPTQRGDRHQREEVTSRAYGSFIASPHRSHGIQSTLGQPSSPNGVRTPSRHPSPTSLPTAAAAQTVSLSTEELYLKYSQLFSRRSEHRASLYPSSSCPSSHASPPAARRDGRSKLLVPEVKLKVRGDSSASLSSGWSPTSEQSRGSEASGSEDGEETLASPVTLPCPRRPVPETRSWSCDSLYHLMPLPMTKEKRVEKRVVNGAEVEVEVEVTQPLKRLFRFAGEESPRVARRTLSRA